MFQRLDDVEKKYAIQTDVNTLSIDISDIEDKIKENVIVYVNDEEISLSDSQLIYSGDNLDINYEFKTDDLVIIKFVIKKLSVCIKQLLCRFQKRIRSINAAHNSCKLIHSAIIIKGGDVCICSAVANLLLNKKMTVGNGCNLCRMSNAKHLCKTTELLEL